MLETSPEQVLQTLQALDLQPGDGLLVHSALQFLGRPQGGPAMYLTCLQTVLGPPGTLAAPAFKFGFAKGLPLDTANQPSKVGRQHVRTPVTSRYLFCRFLL